MELCFLFGMDDHWLVVCPFYVQLFSPSLKKSKKIAPKPNGLDAVLHQRGYQAYDILQIFIQPHNRKTPEQLSPG